MRKAIVLLIVIAAVAVAPSFAELQNVEVGGELQIRGNYIRNGFTGPAPIEVRYGAGLLTGRPVGQVIPGLLAPRGVLSIMGWDNDDNSLKMVEQRTRIAVKADFSDNVSACIELDSYDYWGEDFRSNYVTGVDARAASGNDVEIFQAYVDVNDMWDYPVRMRIGRQEMQFGSEWLVGNNDFALLFQGLSFDGLRLTYMADTWTVDAWWTKLAETSPLEEDGDVDFYGVYATCKAVENMTFDAYWMLVRDARAIASGLWNDFDTTQLHTVGLRAAGVAGAFDYEAEVAYQFGDASQVSSMFRVLGLAEDNADFDNLGAHFDVGYSFDCKYNPRVFLGGAYFEGEDNRDVSFLEWINPFDRPEASISFNRLFSDTIYSGAMDAMRTFSNGYVVRVGMNAMPTEKLGLLLMATYFATDENFDAPKRILGVPMPISPWTDESDDELGIDTCLFLTYQYSEDLTFEAGWAHFWVDDGAEEGNYNFWNGLLFDGGSDDEDADYWYLGSRLKF